MLPWRDVYEILGDKRQIDAMVSILLLKMCPYMYVCRKQNVVWSLISGVWNLWQHPGITIFSLNVITLLCLSFLDYRKGRVNNICLTHLARSTH